MLPCLKTHHSTTPSIAVSKPVYKPWLGTPPSNTLYGSGRLTVTPYLRAMPCIVSCFETRCLITFSGFFMLTAVLPYRLWGLVAAPSSPFSSLLAAIPVLWRGWGGRGGKGEPAWWCRSYTILNILATVQHQPKKLPHVHNSIYPARLYPCKRKTSMHLVFFE